MPSAAGMIMSMAQAVAHLAETERKDVTLDPRACLHSRDKFSTCTSCVDACPVDALRLENGIGAAAILLEREKCVNCGLCMHLCPVGAFEGDDGVADLLAYVSQRQKRGIVELACALHPSAEIGPPQSDLVLRTRNCLAGLGPSAVTSLLALGVQHVLLRVDICQACPMGRARAAIEQTAVQVGALFADEDGRSVPLTLLPNVLEDWPARPVVSAKTPPKSRREFFRSFTAPQDLPANVRELMLVEAPDAAKHPPAERRRLLKSLSFLPGEFLSERPLEAMQQTTIAANENCNACRICERSCPTGALQFAVDGEDHYQLLFSSRACTSCGACIDLCPPGALQRDKTPTLNDWLAGQAQILRSGRLKHCRRCGAGFDDRSDLDFCPVCEFRRRNPFGSKLPEGFNERI